MPTTATNKQAKPGVTGFTAPIAQMPTPQRTRAFYSWINDRFVSRVYVETKGETKVHLPAGIRTAVEMVLYPDLNDFVRVGPTMARLAKPIMPLYHLWFEPGPRVRRSSSWSWPTDQRSTRLPSPRIQGTTMTERKP
ncbi:MAG: hypothetical protein WCE62_08520 [Polyangiales bacterium]